MQKKKFIIITTINNPTEGIKKIAKTCQDWELLIIGDQKTPSNWNGEGINFLSVQAQALLDSAFAQKCPFNHYARKNIGYLQAIKSGAEVIAETDDDNIPYDGFLNAVDRYVEGQLVQKSGWENVYTHFTDAKIWPRGFPLEYINQSLKNKSFLSEISTFDCPIQQYLADGDPDVDAVYRLTTQVETKFRRNTIILSEGTICPFNSQNTVFWPEAYPLLYLPSFVSFRMTDIWRSFIAQICLYKLGKSIAFCEATVFQERNVHSLIRDFQDEVPGYLNNIKIVELLNELPLSDSPRYVGENLRMCYEKLVQAEIILPQELNLVDLWLKDIALFSS